MIDYGHPPKTLEDAVKDKRRYKVEFDKFEGEVCWWAELMEKQEKQLEGGTIIDALENGALVQKPAEGFSAMRIKGLIQCVGIVIEAKDQDGKVVAAAGGHFVTPSSVTEGTINECGLTMIQNLMGLVSGLGTLSARTMVALGSMEGAENSGDYIAGRAAMELINAALQIPMNSEVGASERVYKLKNDGTSTLE